MRLVKAMICAASLMAAIFLFGFLTPLGVIEFIAKATLVIAFIGGWFALFTWIFYEIIPDKTKGREK